MFNYSKNNIYIEKQSNFRKQTIDLSQKYEKT